MTPVWSDLVARASGLGTHLLPRATLAALTDAPDLAALADALMAHGVFIPEGEHSSAQGLESSVRRHAATQLRILERWCAERHDLLVTVTEDEDRRSLRALVRGAVEHAPPDARLAGLIPTTSLPERPLETLAHLATPRLIGVTLSAWSSPYAAPILAEAAGQEPDLLHLDAAINQTWARRMLNAAGRGGFPHYARTLIDIENAYTALALAGERDLPAATNLFLEGGERLSRVAVDAAVHAGALLAADKLARALGPSRLADAIRAGTGDPEGPERAVLAALILDLRDEMRREPLGPAPVLRYALMLRAQTLDLRRIIWGLSLGVPGALLGEGLVTT